MQNMKPFNELFIQCLKLNCTVHKTIFICDTSCKVQGVSTTILRFDNSLGGLTELTEWFVTVKGYRLKLAKGRGV